MSVPSPGFAVVLDTPGPPPRIVVRGEVDIATAGELAACMEQALELGPPVLVDLSQVTFLDSTGLSVIVRALERYDYAEGSIQLIDPPPTVQRTLEITNIIDLVSIDHRSESI